MVLCGCTSNRNDANRNVMEKRNAMRVESEPREVDISNLPSEARKLLVSGEYEKCMSKCWEVGSVDGVFKVLEAYVADGRVCEALMYLEEIACHYPKESNRVTRLLLMLYHTPRVDP